ncbi:MAG TPA: BTAD domain-containing putative transcriptional regulator [Candidatus Dormibacteraeota bacterium]
MSESARLRAPGRLLAAKLRAPRSESLPRERLDDLLSVLWSRRLGLVVAPAGSGKTTLLARFAATAGVPVAWYRPESWDGAAEVFLGYLEEALRTALGDLPGGWTTVEDAARALQTWRGPRALLVIDDLHTLEGTPAEAALERLIEYAPSLHVLAASRAQPRFNLPRLRVSGGLLEIGGDDLRFRSWEVERLFRDFYRAPLPPVELASLARRTEGWAAGLQLFHLATRGKAPEERRRVLAGLGAASRFVREYLTRNVLAELPPELRVFLVDTCVLQRLSGPICDALLGRRDSHVLLQELERRQVFTHALDDGGHYRYHEVLRAHLESILVEEVGEAAVRERHWRAGAVLEEAGALAEALHAHCRAEDWVAVDRLLGNSGEQLLQGSQVWIDALPPAVLANDPWLLLASARRHRADGLWEAALAAYQRAEAGLGAANAAEAARRERQTLSAWLQPGAAPATGTLGLLRAAVRDPRGARAGAAQAGPEAVEVVAGLCALLAGEAREARRVLAAAETGPLVSGALAIGARLGLGVATLLAGDGRGAAEVSAAIEAAEAQGAGLLTRLGHACQALQSGPEGAAAVRFTCQRLGDEWGAALAGLLEGWARAHSAGAAETAAAAPLLEEVAGWFERMEAPVLHAWACALRAFAMARAGGGDAVPVALRAQRLAQARGVDGAALFADAALAMTDLPRRAEHMALMTARRATTGIGGDWAPVGALRAPVEIRLFGGFRIDMDGAALDLSGLKPRVRALLRLLAVQGGRPLHREVIQAVLWPEAPADAGARNLHVAMSSLRQALEPGVARAGFTLLVRDGDAYRLAMGPGLTIDLVAFEADVAAGMFARASNPERAQACFRSALDRYVGELLPEDGSAEWLAGARERCRSAGADAAQGLAELRLERDDASGAAQAAARGLRIDRYHDPLWRLLVRAREHAGDHVAASRARAEYTRVLDELGLPVR